MLNIITNFRDVVALIILFGFAILVHEVGHFMAARWCGMIVEVFSIGFGPAIWKKKVNGITYKIGCIPFGGYVALPQLDPTGMSTIQGSDESDKDAAPGDEKEIHRDIPHVSPWKKILVAFAGPAGNVLLAIVIAWIIYLSPDEEAGSVMDKEPLLIAVTTNSPAAAAGLKTGDEIVAVNGKPVATWYEYHVECMLVNLARPEIGVTVRSDGGERTVRTVVTNGLTGAMVDGVGRFAVCPVLVVVEGGSAAAAGVMPGDLVVEFDGTEIVSPDQFTKLVHEHKETETTLVVNRNGERLTFRVTPVYNKEHAAALIGVVVGLPRHEIPWMQYKEPWAQLEYDARSIKRILKALGTRDEFKQAAGGLGGVVSIVYALWLAIKISILNGLGFLRFLCVNLAIINLVPLPVLDGGHIVFALIQIVTRRQVHPRIVNALVTVSATLLIAAVIFLTYRDIVRLPRMFRAMSGKSAERAMLTNAVPAAATNAAAAGP